MAVRSSVLLLYPVGYAIAHVHFGKLKSFRTSVCSLELCGCLLFFSVFLDCRNEASRLRSLKQIVKFCRASVCKLELWLSGPQFCFYTLWDFHLRLFTSANCEVFSDFSLLFRTVRLLCFLFCFFFWIMLE